MASGAFLLSFANALRLGLQVLMLPILARILGPEAYGVVGLAMPFIMFVNLMCDGGLAGALVREANPSREVESTVFWATLATSVILAALLAAAAWPLASMLGDPAVAPVLAALCPILVVGGLNAVPSARVLREQRFAVLAQADVVSVLAGAACALAAALSGWGVWSLVVQQLVLWTVRLAALWLSSGLRVGWIFRPATLRPLAKFGAGSVASSFLDTATRNVDNLIVGTLLGVHALGHYTMAYQLARMPETMVVGPMHTALFPRLAKHARRPDQANAAFLESLRTMALICAPALTGLAAVAVPFTAVALGPKWVDAAAVLMWLAPAGFALCIHGLATALMMGMGYNRLRLRHSITLAACTLLGVAVGARFSISGVAIGLSVGAGIAIAVLALSLRRHGGLSLRAAVRELQPIALSCALMFVAVKLVDMEAGRGLEPIWRLMLCVMSGMAVFGGSLAFLDRDRLSRDAAVLLTVLRRRAA